MAVSQPLHTMVMEGTAAAIAVLRSSRSGAAIAITMAMPATSMTVSVSAMMTMATMYVMPASVSCQTVTGSLYVINTAMIITAADHNTASLRL